jgi:hypothetical protein
MLVDDTICCYICLLMILYENDDNDYNYMLVDDTICCYMSTPMTVQLMIDEDTK